MIRRVGVTKYIMLTTIAMAGGRSAAAADWSNNVQAAANAGFVTNPRFEPGSNQSDQTAQLEFDDTTTAQTERGQLTITPRLATTRYNHDTDLNIVAGSLDLAYVEKLERGEWSVEALGLTDSTVTSELGTTGITHVNRRHTAGTVSLGYQHFSTERLTWQIQASGQLTRYTDAAEFGLTNYDYGSLQAGPVWSFSERVQGSLLLGADHLHPETGIPQSDYSANLQLKRSFSEQYSWRISVGGTRVNYGSGASSQSTSVYEIGATRKTERVQWDISVRRAVLPIGIGLLTPETVATASLIVATSERSTLNLTVNGIRTNPVFVPEFIFNFLVYSGATWGQASAEWKYHFTPNWALDTAYAYARARNNDVPDWAYGNQVRLGIVWESGRL